MEKMLNIVLFGPPGAGKGTQSENLINKYGLIHLSTGDILRNEIARGTDLGRKAKEIMDKGELVGDDIVIGMIESKLDDNTHAKGFIFDGFPRTAAQAVALDDLLQKKGTGISGMLALEVDDEELTKRLLLRGKDSGRPDDRDENVIRRRIEEYNNKTLPLKNYYSEQGKFHSIHGIGSIDEIFKLLVDRIVFLRAEMDLTALESDLEHLDLTIQDFDEADEIAPELLLEIDAIKRSEAEEEEEAREMKRLIRKETKLKTSEKISVGKQIVKTAAKPLKSKPDVKKAVKTLAKPQAKKNASKKVSKGVQKKAVAKKSTLKSGSQKANKKTAVPAKKLVKKAIKKKLVTKTTAKKASPKKVVKKLVAKKLIKKASPKKIAAKTKTGSTKKKAAKNSGKRK